MGCLRITHGQRSELRVVHTKKGVTSDYRTKRVCYHFAWLTPIWARELEGLEPWYTNESGDNPDNRPTQSKACLGCATRGAEMLTGGDGSFNNSSGNLSLSGKNLFDLGENLEEGGVALEISRTRGKETRAISNVSGNTNGNYTEFLAGPGGAYHSITMLYNSSDVQFSIDDQDTGWDVKNASQSLTQEQFDIFNFSFGNRGPSRLFQLYQQETKEIRISIRQ